MVMTMSVPGLSGPDSGEPLSTSQVPDGTRTRQRGRVSDSPRANRRAPSISAARVWTGPSLLSQRPSSASQWVAAGLTWENVPSLRTMMTAGPSSVVAPDSAHRARTPARMPVARAPESDDISAISASSKGLVASVRIMAKAAQSRSSMRATARSSSVKPK